MPVAPIITLSRKERGRLAREARLRSLAPRLVVRFRIVLLSAEGRTNREIAEELRTSTVTVGLWRRRYATLGVEGIKRDAPRGDGRQRITPELTRRILEATLGRGLPGGGRWSSRRLAEHLGVSHTTIQRVWRLQRLRARPTRPVPRPASL